MPKPKSRKRKGPKSTRAGCLFCKPHKHQSEPKRIRDSDRPRLSERESIEEQV